MTAIQTTQALLATLLLPASLASADIQPTGSTPGVAFDNPSAGVTNITAPDNAIIDYAQFNVGSSQTVNFIQPGAAARVLNRINSNTPTQIDGTINANGIVYFVNPSGVTFGPNSVLDAAGVFAAAGSLSNSDFLSGTNQFNNISGNVEAHGTIRADSIAALIGRNVLNTGTISVPNGTAILASGDQVLIGNPLGGILVSVDATPLTGDDGGVTDNGNINANELSLVSGDLASLALTSSLQASSSSSSTFTPNLTIADIDTDGDGDIDNDDLRTAFDNFTGPLQPGVGNKTQQLGDTDGDGDVDNTDIGTLIIFFTGPITTPPPPGNPAGPFSLSAVESVGLLPPITEEVNLTEADLGILRDQLGIAARQPLAQERIEKTQARALYDDLAARPTGNETNPDGSLTIANTRLDADVVRQALQLYRQRIGVEGVSPAERVAQIRSEVDTAFTQYSASLDEGAAFDPAKFCAFVQEENRELIDDLDALNELRRMTKNMGLSEAEKSNSERTIIERARPDGISYEQMKATIEAAGGFTLADPTQPDAG